jgi:hypothetical protein
MISLLARLRAAVSAGRSRELVSAVLVPFAVQRALLFLVVFLATALIPAQRGVEALPRLPLVGDWIRWDSIYYLIVARDGYGPHPVDRADAFFPGYPWLVRLLDRVLPLPLAAFVVANLNALLALGALYLLLRRTDPPEVSRRVVWVALLFPSSFFLSAGYAESTCLLALTLTVLAWRGRRQLLAAVAAAATSLARPVGSVCSSLPFLAEWLVCSRRRQDLHWFTLGAGAGVGALLLTHYRASGDPLAFMHVRNVEVLGSQVYFRSPHPWWEVLLDEGVGANLSRRLLNWGALGATAAACVHLLRRREIDLALIAVLAVLVPLLFQRSVFDAFGMARYALVGFPLFIAIARWTPTGIRARATDVGFAMLQLVLALAFVSWRWGE